MNNWCFSMVVAWLLIGASSCCAQLLSASVGVLRYGDRASSEGYVAAFKNGMSQLGYTDGKNVKFEMRFADGKAERLDALAEELVRLKVNVIMAMDTPATRAAQKATRTIPIVIGNATDPVGNGLVSSLSRPGGNTTGLSNMASDLSPKRLELLAAIVPKLSRIGVLFDPSNPATKVELKNIENANRGFGVAIIPMPTKSIEEIENVFSSLAKQRVDGLILTSNPVLNQHVRQISAWALKYRMPTLSTVSRHAEMGLLLTYGPDIDETYARAALFVDKILKGSKPGELPVEQPTTILTVLNAKTAKSLGLQIPNSILVQATKVIE